METNKQTLQALLNKAISRVHPFVLLTWCVGILLAYLMGMYVTGPLHSSSRWMGAMLACSSVVVVLQKPGYKESLKLGWSRVLGTLFGALVAYLYLLWFPFTVVGMLLTVLILETIFMLINIYNNGHIATLTLLIILLVSQMSPDSDPAMNCMLRFSESVVGVAVGVALLWVIEVWNRWRQRLQHMGANPDGQPVNMDTMPLRWGHFRVLVIASMGQLTGAGLSTLVGIVIPMLQIVRHPELSAWQQGGLASMSLVGIMVGSMAIGEWSDRRGYLFFFRLCPALILAASLLAMMADGVGVLAVSLFVMGVGIGGGYSLDSDYISEIMPRRWRLLMVGVAKSFSALGNILVAFACMQMLRTWHDAHFWNRLFVLISLLAAGMLLSRVRFTQSPGWLLAQGRVAEAEQAVRYLLGSDVELGELRDKPGHQHSSVRMNDLFTRANLKKIVFSGVPWACEGVAVYGIGVFLPVLIMALGLGEASMEPLRHIVNSVRTSVYISLFILLGFVCGLFLVNRWNHVRTQTWGFVLAAAGLSLLLTADRLHWPVWMAVAGFMVFEFFLNAGPHLMTFIIPPQIYPVAERGAGAGLAAAFGKLGAVVGVFFLPLLLKHGGTLAVLLVTVAILLVGALVTALLGRRVMPASGGAPHP